MVQKIHPQVCNLGPEFFPKKLSGFQSSNCSVVDRGILSHISNMNFQFWAGFGQSGLQREKKIQTAMRILLFFCFHGQYKYCSVLTKKLHTVFSLIIIFFWTLKKRNLVSAQFPTWGWLPFWPTQVKSWIFFYFWGILGFFQAQEKLSFTM